MIDWIKEQWNIFSAEIADTFLTSGKNLLFAAIILILGLIVIKLTVRALKRRLKKSESKNPLHNFLISSLRVILYIILFFVIIGVLGVPSSSFLVIFGSASVAIGLAVQGSLSNFVGGIIIIANKPFSVGDYIEINEMAGSVKKVGLINTQITTLDNKVIIIPNSEASNSKVINYSFNNTRRVEIKFSVGHGADVERVKKIITDVCVNTDKILLPNISKLNKEIKNEKGKNLSKTLEELSKNLDSKTDEKNITVQASDNSDNKSGSGKKSASRKRKDFSKAILALRLDEDDKSDFILPPSVRLFEITPSALIFVAYVWIKKTDYWAVYFDLTEAILERLKLENIAIPHPQLDVSIINQK